MSVIWRKPVLTYAVNVSIDGLGEFGEMSWEHIGENVLGNI